MNHDFQGGLVVKSLPASAEDTKDTGSSPESGRSPRGGNVPPHIPLEEEMLQYSCWEIPGTEEPGGLQSMGSQESQTWFNDKTTTD